MKHFLFGVGITVSTMILIARIANHWDTWIKYLMDEILVTRQNLRNHTHRVIDNKTEEFTAKTSAPFFVR